MKAAPRELRVPGAYILDFEAASEGPAKLTLADMPFWDIAALLSAVRYEVSVLPPDAKRGDLPRRESRYKIEGVTGTHHGDGEVSFLFDRTIDPDDMFARITDVYETVLTETYAQRARSEERIRPGMPRRIAQDAGELAVGEALQAPAIDAYDMEQLMPDSNYAALELLPRITPESGGARTLL